MSDTQRTTDAGRSPAPASDGLLAAGERARDHARAIGLRFMDGDRLLEADGEDELAVIESLIEAALGGRTAPEPR